MASEYNSHKKVKFDVIFVGYLKTLTLIELYGASKGRMF
jgi:hypothetical protein